MASAAMDLCVEVSYPDFIPEPIQNLFIIERELLFNATVNTF